ncbi:MAG: hypothetical protein EON54_09130 [Alcaligenaceae bacterium]|nr:MAG: hypothetical protein EON54_09130 [Alcaligenaceae bacterium]
MKFFSLICDDGECACVGHLAPVGALRHLSVGKARTKVRAAASRPLQPAWEKPSGNQCCAASGACLIAASDGVDRRAETR